MKKSLVCRLAVIVIAVGFSIGMYGCAATQLALEKKDLDVQTKMSETIFLDPVGPDKKTVFVDIKNTSDKEVNIASDVAGAIAAKGYKVVQDPNQAHYLLQANILSVAKTDPSALQSVIGAGYGGAVFGGAVGAGIGAATGRSWGSTAAGGIIGGIAETVAGALVKDVYYAMITDVQISERSSAPVSQVMTSNLTQGTQTTVQQQAEGTTNWKRYRTRIGTSANQVNLKFEEALPEIQKGLCKCIGGLF
ncbi:MAG: complement resistance protein TraT [Deltaproteobacteria bacterium]|nr:complement resistance protein TraT [Deltaproteobacteria bacterium]